MKFTKKDIFQFVAFACILIVATVVKEAISTSDEKPEFETYLFIDHVGTLHTSSSCEGIKPLRSSTSLHIGNVKKHHLDKICTRCVTEAQLNELIKRTENIQTQQPDHSGLYGSNFDNVYICTGPQAKSYHNDANCMGLQSCSAEVEQVSIEEAKDEGRKPCRYCCK